MSHAAPPLSAVDSAAVSADRVAHGVLTASTDVAAAVRRARQAIEAIDPWQPPARDAALLLSSLAAAAPGALPVEIGNALTDVIRRSDLSQTWQPGLDEVFQLLPLLIPTPAGKVLPGLLSEIASRDHLHDRWARRAVELWAGIAFWRPELLDVEETLAAAGRSSESTRKRLFNEVVVPLLLADPASLSIDRFQRACSVPAEKIEARYLASALAAHPDTPASVREFATEVARGWFPLRAVWQRICGQRGLRVLCIQNIADAQGDEIVRTVPLLQALLDHHPDTRITLITDRAYLYSHKRIQTLSFDDQEGKERALGTAPDVLIEFIESEQAHLNYDRDLISAITQVRATTRPLLDIRAGKGWNSFLFNEVRLGGLDWARAFGLDRHHSASVYDPALRLIIELGLPPRIGQQQPRSGSVLAGQPWSVADAAWRDLVWPNHEGRPVAIVNPFGGAGPLKGFVSRKFADLAGLLVSLTGEGYFVILCPTGAAWGSSQTAQHVRSLLSEHQQQQVAIAPDPVDRPAMLPLDDAASRSAPYASVIMRQFIHFVARANLVVTVEGWMAHAAYLQGKPYRLLMLPDSDRTAWQPWGRSSNQRVWLFRGDAALDRPPLPEQPRKRAWLHLISRATEPEWLGLLEEASRTEDRSIRVAATRAIGQIDAPGVLPTLIGLLRDRSHLVRGAAADALLNHYQSQLGRDDLPNADTLKVVRLIGISPTNWRAVHRYGSLAIEPLTAAIIGDDPVIRREAAALLERINREQASEQGRGQGQREE